MRMRAAPAAMVILLGALAGQVAGASASKASIKAAVKSYDSRILVAEGHLVSAIGEYKASKNPAAVESALTSSIEVFQSLRKKISHQSAVRPKVKAGKAKLIKGLATVAVAYERLKTAYADRQTSPAAAQAAVESSLVAVKAGRRELSEGIKLLR
jgi:hypothetical protein